MRQTQPKSRIILIKKSILSPTLFLQIINYLLMLLLWVVSYYGYTNFSASYAAHHGWLIVTELQLRLGVHLVHVIPKMSIGKATPQKLVQIANMLSTIAMYASSLIYHDFPLYLSFMLYIDFWYLACITCFKLIKVIFTYLDFIAPTLLFLSNTTG